MNSVNQILPAAGSNIGVEDVTALIRSLGWKKLEHAYIRQGGSAPASNCSDL